MTALRGLDGWSAEVGIAPDYGPGNHSRQTTPKLNSFSPEYITSEGMVYENLVRSASLVSIVYINIS